MAFVANGLLGPATALSDIIDSGSSSSFSFGSNGLLGPSTVNDSNVPEKDTGITDQETPDNGGTKFSFIENRPLSDPAPNSSGSSFSFAPNGLLSSTQDDAEDLPSVSQMLGLPSRTDASLLSNSSTSSSFTPRLSVRATTFDGKTIYMRKKIKKTRDTLPGGSSASSRRIGNLLETPIHRLMDDISVAEAKRLRDADKFAAIRSNSNDAPEDTLWVDRYRPQRFVDLMGNERVARETMAWVKQWDWCVFGNKKGKKRTRDADENADEQDEYHRPREKLLLLSGPPGLGKTTLAHVIARQAGYEVMEINASDARSGQVVEDRIRPALESGSAVGSTKPVLLIIDEIDGATGAGENSNSFVHKLVQLTYDRPRKKQRPGQKRDPNAKRPILRPIICICNDQNASSLAKLRPVAHQIRFSRPADIHTVRRLREICEIEGLKADSRALSTLVGVARGDLRGCLNTLQFIKSRNEDVTESIIRAATVGMKEAESSVISVLNDLFSPMTKKRVKELGMSEGDDTKYVARLSQEVDGSGRESAIAIGCFSHYATLCRHDADFTGKYQQANEWLGDFDRFSSAMYLDGDFALNQYLPYLLVPFYPLFQERGTPRVERSQADWENLQLTRTNEEIYKSLSRCLRTATVRHGGDYRHLVSTPVLQLEFAPFINRIISPSLRPVNSQVIRPEERALLNRLVDIMASLELRFVQERAEDGQLSYRLDPPIDVFITYDSKRAGDIAVSRYAVRHFVAQEVDARLAVRDSEVVEKGKRGKHDLFGKASIASGGDGERPINGITNLSNANEPSNKRIKLGKVDIADKPPTDFFGRPITTPSATTTKAAARKNVEKKYRVSYRFAEGNSAAVRKHVKVSMFL
ncbi:P-loop containing nucleoside triphosphate hydrolase protein [Crucibulum laeve]|uniref:P-loop containing nucleoside triphosphate hydrolase protein n=1 Tax=Crucibulum laeve TaxID=68775 RepID=A0A5C3MA74_9AGAR|nr:P-loop containing nucleoside triphosphate hydrolase protein [Crucibulum laeve]